MKVCVEQSSIYPYKSTIIARKDKIYYVILI